MMFRITIKYRDSRPDEVIEEHDYNKTWNLANSYWGGNIKSVHVKEVK